MQQYNDTSDWEFGVVRKKLSIFHSVRSVPIAKLRSKVGQNTMELDYKIDKGSDSNLMPINMFKWYVQEHQLQN